MEGTNMVTPTKTLRLRPQLRAEIDRIARRTRRSFSEVTQDLLEEALRMRECPGIYFADEPSGREAKVGGTGLGVWELIVMYRDARRNERVLKRRFPHLSPAQIKAALLYYARFPAEIDQAIEENAALTFAAVEAKAPGLVRRV
jgi:uncharacterized protein (DUF433 family)